MNKYTYEINPYEGYDIKKDGHIMMPEDVAKELNNLTRKVKKLKENSK